MPINNNASAKTFQELEKMDIRKAKSYFKQLSQILDKTEATWNESLARIDLENVINHVIACLLTNCINHKKVMVVGNGGSAAIALHTLVDYANAGGIKTIDFYSPAMLTCMANDYGYENVFSGPIEHFADAGDILFAISSSGKSPNIIKACEAAIKHGCVVVTFSGFETDNPLRKSGNINFYVPSTHYGFVELAHQTLLHCILDLFIKMKVHNEAREFAG